jgi:hypothetical protein
MVSLTGIKHRTYQKIEKSGEVIKTEELIRIIEKTGFSFTQKIAPSKSLGPPDIEKELILKDLVESLKAQLRDAHEKISRLEKENQELKNGIPPESSIKAV